MKSKKTAVIRCTSCVLILFFVGSFLKSTQAQVSLVPQERQAFGNSIVLGNPNNAIEDLQKIHRLLLKYRVRSGGLPPLTSVSLLQDLIKDPGDYGFADYESTIPIFSNPDSVYAGVPDVNTYVPYPITNKRPDGSALGSPKAIGTRDLWSYTDIYYHSNANNGNKGAFNNPIGFYIVLWDNGSIDEIPYDLVISAPRNGQLRRPFFPNQTNIPYDGLTYAEAFIRLASDENIPLGKPIFSNEGVAVKDNGGPESLVQLSRRLSYPTMYGIKRENLWQTFDSDQAEFNLNNVQVGSTKLGLDTKVDKQALTQLQKSGTPALLFLQDDGRIVTLTALDDDRAVVIDRGLTQNVERSVLEKRYSGEALVPTKALTQNAAIIADDAVREVKLPSLDAEVPQQFVLRNTGTTPVTLQLEYPLLGVTESKLSKDVIAPGETAMLDLKVKWRSILKAPYQNVLVSIQTNDPIVPRLQLAILLTPPKGAGN